MYSASEHKEIIQGYQDEEERAQRIWRVTPEKGAGRVQCSPFQRKEGRGSGAL